MSKDLEAFHESDQEKVERSDDPMQPRPRDWWPARMVEDDEKIECDVHIRCDGKNYRIAVGMRKNDEDSKIRRDREFFANAVWQSRELIRMGKSEELNKVVIEISLP